MPAIFKGDRILLTVVIALMLFSLPIVFTSISTLAYKSNSYLMPFVKHFGLLAVGLAAIVIVHRIPFKLYARIAPVILGLAIILLILTLLFGQNLNSAVRSLPILGISFQTSDFAKIAMVIFTASLLARHERDINNPTKVLFPILGMLFVVDILIMMADLSTALLLTTTILLMLFIAGVKWYSLILVVVVSGLFFFGTTQVIEAVYPNSRVSTWSSRIETFLGMGDTVDSEKNFQSNQSQIAIATGFPFGKGPGHSTQRNILPHPYSDFAFAIIVEEWGVFGWVMVIILYFMLLARAVIIARQSKHFLGSLMVMGLSLGIIIQAIINMAVCTNLMPVTGQPLPFISMGGSSILFTSVAIGIILNVGAHSLVNPKTA